MIYIHRGAIALPSVLESPRIEEARRKAAAAFPRRLRPSRQSHFEFDTSWYREVRAQLSQGFFWKCAYCETKFGPNELLEMEHFRPIRSVAEASDHPGYWWLAYEWTNLLGVCRQCNVNKANRFPLADESRRAYRPNELHWEENLLLDPCTDHPSQHFVFSSDGLVSSETARGQATIAILHLNRPDLVERRRSAAERVAATIEMIRQRVNWEPGSINAIHEWLRAHTEPHCEFAALGRQLVIPALSQHLGKESANAFRNWEEPMLVVTKTHRERIKKSFHDFEISQSSYSLDTDEGREAFRLQRRLIESIKIRNFKSLHDLDLEFATSPEHNSSWLMLLGENGTGKSSILQAVAMTLMGTGSFRRQIADQELEWGDFVRKGAKSATVAVKLSGFIAPHTLSLTARNAVFRSPTGQETTVKVKDGQLVKEGEDHDVPTVLLGYGATRLLRHRDDERYGMPNCRVDNLFDPLKPLLNAEKWLLGLPKKSFDEVAIVLKDILDLDSDAKLLRRKGRVLVHANGSAVTLRQLSDGYQSVVAMTVDILEVAMRLWPQASSAEGIVLLDEIGSHLHPRWRMRIVESLRRALPRLQFLVTTHEPLCLRGVGKGEVVVLRRDDMRRVQKIEDLPSPADFRVDQLLTSEFFGLDSTTDPDAEAVFDEYYALLALSSRTPEQTSRLEFLKGDLKDRRYVGTTPRDQLMFEAIDSLLAQQRHGERRKVPQLKAEAISEISKIWDEA